MRTQPPGAGLERDAHPEPESSSPLRHDAHPQAVEWDFFPLVGLLALPDLRTDTCTKDAEADRSRHHPSLVHWRPAIVGYGVPDPDPDQYATCSPDYRPRPFVRSVPLQDLQPHHIGADALILAVQLLPNAASASCT